jgi:acyl-CoA reductase-like NAD-dependent aldehyde dehydrogenase
MIAEKVSASAAKSLTPLCLELGGKDPCLVLDDVPKSDLDRVIATLVRGVFQSAGQNCIGIERIICGSKIYDTIVSRLQPIIESLRPGSALDSLQASQGQDDPIVDVGACVSDARFPELESLIQEAVKDGARLLVGGKRYIHPLYPAGHYFSPTLLVDVTPTMRIAQEELFAPIAVIMRASSPDDAISIANSTPYGLGASAFGSSSSDLDRCVREIQAGMVAVNDFAAFYAVQLPFGGVKGSGYGRFAGEEGLRGLCNQKSICVDRWPGLKTSIPPPLRLPYKKEGVAWNFCKGIVELGYGESLRRRARGLMRLAGF